MNLSELNILFLDNHLVVVEKPRGMLTQPTNENQEALEGKVKAFLKQKLNKPQGVFLHVVHRLDQVVSGIVLFAKTSKALERLNQASREKQFVKIYIAEVEKVISEDRKTLVHYLKHDEFKATITNRNDKEAKEAILSYQVIERKKDSTIVKIRLETGRYHQIRAQFKAFGHPIKGDFKYGAKKINDEGIYLHHAYLEFDHPITKEKIKIVSQPDFYPSKISF